MRSLRFTSLVVISALTFVGCGTPGFTSESSLLRDPDAPRGEPKEPTREPNEPLRGTIRARPPQPKPERPTKDPQDNPNKTPPESPEAKAKREYKEKLAKKIAELRVSYPTLPTAQKAFEDTIKSVNALLDTGLPITGEQELLLDATARHMYEMSTNSKESPANVEITVVRNKVNIEAGFEKGFSIKGGVEGQGDKKIEVIITSPGGTKTPYNFYKNPYVESSELLTETDYETTLVSLSGRPADYDGDGKADLSVKSTDGTWYIDYSSNGFGYFDVKFPGYGGVAVPADYDGDGKADLSVKSSSGDDAGTWYIDYSSNGFGYFDVKFHGYGSTAVPADYDGDGKADLSVKDRSTWYIDYSRDGFRYFDVSFRGYGY